jgi:PEP-CTERM motif
MPPSGFVVTFDEAGVNPDAYGTTTPVDFGVGGVQFSGSGVVMDNHGLGSDDLYATPFGDDNNNYMAVLGGGTEDINYSSLRDSFGLYWGSVDIYNSLAFYNGNTLVATVTGSEVDPPMLADGDQTGFGSNGYVLINSLPKFNEVVVASTADSFELDNVVAGVPEPSTWAMMLLGFAGLGYAAYRKTKTERMAFA